jgi:hypothetical protein
MKQLLIWDRIKNEKWDIMIIGTDRNWKLKEIHLPKKVF